MPGKKHFQKSGLGKSLVNTTNKPSMNNRSSRHTAVLNDGSDYGKLNLRSVTQESSLDEFITIAQMAGDAFTKDRENVTIITKTTRQGVLSDEEKQALIKEQEENSDIIAIPRRPPWDPDMSIEDLTRAENDSFLNWRRKLAEFQEKSKLTLTPFEKNVEFWRQLWRVVERSDVIVQVLDARNPLLFLSKDLQKYVKEVDQNKMNLIILNKADLLTDTQRATWADYFERQGIRAVFFSALQETTQENSEEKESDESKSNSGISESDNTSEDESEDDRQEDENSRSREKESTETSDELNQVGVKESQKDPESSETIRDKEKLTCDGNNEEIPISNNEEGQEKEGIEKEEQDNADTPGKILGREELVDFLKTVYPDDRPKVKDQYVTIGLVGYPNVGKSSTINALIQCKKVSISATPGKTKHFQTLFLDDDLCLCDCPGLVFPNFVSNKAEMILNGILPIDQMNDHVPPINLLISLVPTYVFEVQYSITLPLETHNDVQLTAEQLLNAYGYMRGFMTQRGLPDNPRSARYILKDFVNGKLVYCVAPPGVEQSDFHKFTDHHRPRPRHITRKQEILLNFNSYNVKSFDNNYFTAIASKAYAKGPINVVNAARVSGPNSSKNDVTMPEVSKPWRQHSKRNTKQKLRKQFAHLDVK
ncbi:large subunit GTPase 1 homolog [Tetranychus urticae]|uniref:Large subunit GTPase 1 homolog n=1 Tax=Tetranychus urticae TaxID=32264 RepID=T1KHW4_TETUR|nr:large subunit GTPase 1 homolog [Tetranychus urticae]